MRSRFLLLSMGLLSAACSQNDCGDRLPSTELVIGPNALVVEVADSEASKRCGLAFRAELPLENGMLFVYEEEKPRAFWMKNTRIPLSIAFLDASKRIINIEDMQALSNERYHSVAPAKYALETNIGWFKRHGIGPGDIVEFDLSALAQGSR